MTKENAHLFLPFVQALADGKSIQYRHKNEPADAWITPSIGLNWTFSENVEYRIKPGSIAAETLASSSEEGDAEGYILHLRDIADKLQQWLDKHEGRAGE